MENLSPIIIFAFNRPEALRRTINALQVNQESKESDLYIYVDGPRAGNMDDVNKVHEVCEIAKKTTGFRTVKYKFSNINNGLGPSIIKGVGEVLTLNNSVIVIEDDLIVQPNFLSFMNSALRHYESDKKIWSICGYSNKISPPKDYQYDAYLCTRSSSWGWGTWVDRWESVDWTFDNWNEWTKLRKSFNMWGGSDCFSMLNNCRLGKNKSWAIRFCFNQFLQDKLSIFPIKSLVNNNGFDGEGTNCKKYSRFKFELMHPDKYSFKFPDNVNMNTDLHK
ncbi:MAG: glycosyl transferase, partial [Muribaculum sp.]|nr:glycosyl transferase [Muribaculum sp.]